MTSDEKKRLEEIERWQFNSQDDIKFLTKLIHRQQAALTVARGALERLIYECALPGAATLVENTLTQLDAIAKAEAVVELGCTKNSYGLWVATEMKPLVKNCTHKGILIVLPKEGEHE